MIQVLLKFILIAGFCLVISHADKCYQSANSGYYTYDYYFYCCGYCSGPINNEQCNDNAEGIYYYSYYDCDYWRAGPIAGVVVGSLIGLAVTITAIVLLCRLCSRRQTTGHVFHPAPSSGITVVSSNVTASTGLISAQHYPSYQQAPYSPHLPVGNYGPPQPPPSGKY